MFRNFLENTGCGRINGQKFVQIPPRCFDEMNKCELREERQFRLLQVTYVLPTEEIKGAILNTTNLEWPRLRTVFDQALQKTVPFFDFWVFCGNQSADNFTFIVCAVQNAITVDEQIDV